MKWCFKILPLLLLTACGPQSSNDAGNGQTQQPAVNAKTQAQIDKDVIINYAMDNYLEVKSTPSGLYYQILAEGQGLPLQQGARIRMHYRGNLQDGSEFDSSFKRNEAMTITIGDLIPGLNEGLQLTQLNGKIRLFIPSELGYGKEGLVTNGVTIVPQNAVLIYDIEVMEIL